jgi:hypothetical protein
MAVIGHHPRTGATVFLQFYKPAAPKSGRVVVSPFSPGGEAFWSPLDTIADNFQCQRCHTVGPFIHTAWIDQVRVRRAAPGAPPADPMVPSDPLGPYFFIDAADGELFAPWDATLVAARGGGHLNKPDNKCTQCHRVAPDLIGLNQNSTRYAGLDPADYKAYSVRSDSFQTPRYRELHWMPPVSMPTTDFYAGQEATAPYWEQTFGKSASEVNGLAKSDTSWAGANAQGLVADVPRPPAEYQTIMVDRPEQDQVAPGSSMWILDTRMRANTDGDLDQWRFYGKAPANANTQAAPVVYRRVPGNGGKVEFEVVFVGEARSSGSAGQWVTVAAQTFPTRQGDYFGVVFTNTGTESGSAPIPYSKDTWAVQKAPDGTTRFDNGFGSWQGYVTLRLTAGDAPAVGKRLSFTDPGDYRTYSFEFKNRL